MLSPYLLLHCLLTKSITRGQCRAKGRSGCVEWSELAMLLKDCAGGKTAGTIIYIPHARSLECEFDVNELRREGLYSSDLCHVPICQFKQAVGWAQHIEVMHLDSHKVLHWPTPSNMFQVNKVSIQRLLIVTCSEDISLSWNYNTFKSAPIFQLSEHFCPYSST